MQASDSARRLRSPSTRRSARRSPRPFGAARSGSRSESRCSPDGGVSAAIADDGVEERRGASLEAIRERARILGGTVSIEPGPEGGTVVLLVVPPYVAAAV